MHAYTWWDTMILKLPRKLALLMLMMLMMISGPGFATTSLGHSA